MNAAMETLWHVVQWTLAGIGILTLVVMAFAGYLDSPHSPEDSTTVERPAGQPEADDDPDGYEDCVRRLAELEYTAERRLRELRGGR